MSAILSKKILQVEVDWGLWKISGFEMIFLSGFICYIGDFWAIFANLC